MFSSKPAGLVGPDAALPGRHEPMPVSARHVVTGNPLQGPFPAGIAQVQLGLGCFWGAERLFWRLPGVFTTAVGYAGGHTPNPTYREVCSGQTDQTEVVLVAYDPRQLDLCKLLQQFWQAHDPTAGMRQGNDVGTQYRSAIYVDSLQDLEIAQASCDRYQQALTAAGFGPITTEIRLQVPFFYAEDYHQQYLAKNPDGYCGLRGTGVPCPHAK